MKKCNLLLNSIRKVVLPYELIDVERTRCEGTWRCIRCSIKIHLSVIYNAQIFEGV